MTEEERQAFLMFAGTMHGQARATDQMLVGQSNNLRPISQDIQTKFAEVLQTPPQQYTPFVQQEPTEPIVYQQPPPDNFVGVEQAARELAAVQPVQHFIPQSPITINSDIVDALKEINLNLARIATTLESHGGQKRTKSTKSA